MVHTPAIWHDPCNWHPGMMSSKSTQSAQSIKSAQSDKPLMELRYPRSFLALLLVGFLIVALPLIAGLVSNAFSIEKLSEQSQKAVYNATVATQNTRQIASVAAAMERSGRYYAASGDRDVIETYKQSRESFDRLMTEFIALPLNAEMRDAAEKIQKRERSIFASLTEKTPSPEFSKQLERDFADLAQRTQSFNVLANQLIDQEVAALRASAAKSRKQVFWQLLAMIPSALLLIAGFAYLLARPIRDLGEAIHRLGEGKLAKRIVVTGPHDIEMLGEQLDWLRQRLISLEDQKTRFFQHVSHELKTPLTALREGSDLLSDEVVGKLNDEQREVARILKQNSLTLEVLIQDLLTYSQTQSADRLDRKTAFETKPLQLKDLIDDVVEMQKIAIVSKSLTVRRECEKTSYHGDPEKLRVVIDNLLSNAIKYSPVGGTVVLRLGRHKDNAIIEVIDNGPGIPAEDRDRIFDPFYRGKNATQSGTKGTGLGLAIVRDYVEMHQGSVKALAAAGAHFRVVLPKLASAN
jgi:two-component system, NtrC family, sensor histidine kinase GlrK